MYLARCFLLLLVTCIPLCNTSAQVAVRMAPLKEVSHTPVKNQALTGTCWSFSMISLIESQSIKKGLGELDISEMFIVRSIYREKAKNYILRQGAAQFGEGGLGHDVINAVAKYGAMPETVYSGLPLNQEGHNHQALAGELKNYLDSLLKTRPIPSDWLVTFDRLLDSHLGKVPPTFIYGEKQYTPTTFAQEILQFNDSDYINLTSFSHHPFYTAFILEVPDNFSNGWYYNVPLNEMISLTKDAVENGYSLMWDADVSNTNFRQQSGFALQLADPSRKEIGPDDIEIKYDQLTRQKLFEDLTTQDDHLMHLVGIERSPGGKDFFLVKNSWGNVGPYDGYIHVSETYFAINTVSLVVPKEALSKSLKDKLGIR
jgi:bleomycin hydrolase